MIINTNYRMGAFVDLCHVVAINHVDIGKHHAHLVHNVASHLVLLHVTLAKNIIVDTITAVVTVV